MKQLLGQEQPVAETKRTKEKEQKPSSGNFKQTKTVISKPKFQRVESDNETDTDAESDSDSDFSISDMSDFDSDMSEMSDMSDMSDLETETEPSDFSESEATNKDSESDTELSDSEDSRKNKAEKRKKRSHRTRRRAQSSDTAFHNEGIKTGDKKASWIQKEKQRELDLENIKRQLREKEKEVEDLKDSLHAVVMVREELAAKKNKKKDKIKGLHEQLKATELQRQQCEKEVDDLKHHIEEKQMSYEEQIREINKRLDATVTDKEDMLIKLEKSIQKLKDKKNAIKRKLLDSEKQWREEIEREKQYTETQREKINEITRLLDVEKARAEENSLIVGQLKRQYETLQKSEQEIKQKEIAAEAERDRLKKVTEELRSKISEGESKRKIEEDEFRQHMQEWEVNLCDSLSSTLLSHFVMSTGREKKKR